MLDDIDYSDLTSSAQPAEAKSTKKATIAERKISSKAEKPKPVDVDALANRATELEAGLGAPQIGDTLAEYGLPGVGVLSGLAAAYGMYKASQNKPIAGPVIQAPPNAINGASPSVNYEVPAYMRNPAATPIATTPAPAAPAEPDRLQRAAQMIEANRQAGLGGQPMAPVAAPDMPAGPVAPAAPAYVAPVPMTEAETIAAFRGEPISTPLSQAPVDAPAPMPSAGPKSAVTEVVVDEIKSLMNEAPAAPQPVAPPGELRTGTGKLAYAGEGPEAKISKRTGKPQFSPEYASMKDVPKDHAFIPNAQYIDALRQDLGQAEYTKAFTGRPFPADYEQAIAEGKDINRSLGRATREEAKAAGMAYGEITPGIAKKTTANKKLVNVKGVGLGALVALPDLVKAETTGQRAMAGANLLEAILPPGFAMSGAGEGSDQPPRQRDPRMANINMTNASMFAPTTNDLYVGNPYAQSELAKRIRQDQEYNRKVGAGRGIAPPSAYMR